VATEAPAVGASLTLATPVVVTAAAAVNDDNEGGQKKGALAELEGHALKLDDPVRNGHGRSEKKKKKRMNGFFI